MFQVDGAKKKKQRKKKEDKDTEEHVALTSNQNWFNGVKWTRLEWSKCKAASQSRLYT